MNEAWLSITEAAARLSAAGDTIDRSSLSRYVKQHAEALPQRREGKANLVEFHALAQHRGENVRLRETAGGSNSETTTPRPAAASRSAEGGGPRSRNDATARKAIADAELREMDLAERRRRLVPTSEVDKAGRDAIALMTSAYERAIDVEASELSLKYGWDERTVRLALKGYARKGLEVFHREMLGRLDDMNRAEEADQPAIVSDGVTLQ